MNDNDKNDKFDILIVDDVPVNLALLAKLLKDLDLNVVKANSGQKALELMEEYDFALVLLDIQMPGMDGFETSERMKSNEKTKHVPIIFVTAANEEKYIFRGYETGAVDFLFKPVNKHILRSKVSIFLDLYKQKKQLKDLSIQDGLTGLYNHHQMDKILKQEFSRANRYGTDLSCLLIDLDFFKVVNDTFGHAFGDFVLKGFADILKAHTRESDYTFRYGGEEFMILLPQTDIVGAEIVAEKLRNICEDNVYTDASNSTTVTLSIGVSSIVHNRPGQPETLLAYADKAVYRAKAEGRNRVKIYIEDTSSNKPGDAKVDKNINYLKEHLSSVLEKTKKSYMSSLQLLVQDITNTKFQSYNQRVLLYMDLIGEKLRLPQPIIETFKRSASLHNCFTILLGKDLISRKDSLTEEEKADLEAHPYMLTELTLLFDFFSDERSILQYHHENFDGSGFPEGLEGDQIPLGARIFSIAEAIVEMTTSLPDQQALSSENVIKELSDNMGTRFDPMLVTFFRDIIKEQNSLIEIRKIKKIYNKR